MMRIVRQFGPAVAGLAIIVVVTSLSAPGTLRASGTRLHAESRREQVLDQYAGLQSAFVENRGQIDARVRYYAHGARYGFYLTRDALVLSFAKSTMGSAAIASKQTAGGVNLALRFLGANPKVVVEGEGRAAGDAHYLLGDDPDRWRTNVPRYNRVVYRALWPGVDLAFVDASGSLKYEFHVKPGARVDDIRLAYVGAESLTVDGTGALLIGTAMGVLRDAPPVAYQEIDGTRVPVTSRYALRRSAGAQKAYGFVVGAGYSPDRPLVIDPGLGYSTFLGGTSHESASALAVDAAGNAYIVGFTQSPNFPTTAGAFDRTGSASNNLDAFVTKLNPTGTALVYSTFLGAGSSEWGRAIAIDAAGNAFITGQTKSSSFPTTGGAFDRTFNVDNCPRCGIDQEDAFVAKLNADGSRLVYSTFLGGTQFDDGLAIAVDGSGNAYVAGETGSSNFPTTAGAFDRTPNGEFDAFVTKLNATGSALVYSTYLGGSLVDLPSDIDVDSANTAFIAGGTRSPDFPTTAGAFDTSANGAFDGFVTRLNASGSGLLYSTFLGGSDMESAGSIAIDAAGNAYLAGGTPSPDFPTTPGAFDNVLDGGFDAFVTKLNPAGSALVFSTFVGGSEGDSFSGLALDGNGSIWVSGSTSSVDFPVTADALDPSFNGSVTDAIVANLNGDGASLLFATFLGGSENEGSSDIALDAGGNVFVTGGTMSPDFPTTPGAFDRVWNGDPLIFWADAFVAKLSSDGIVPPDPGPPPPPALASLSLNPSSLTGGLASTATITLTSAAGIGGVLLTLSSSNPSVATVPPSVGIEAGQTSVPVGVLTSGVSASTGVTISATHNGVTVSALLTVLPEAPPPPSALPAPALLSPAHDARFAPGQAITFDWSDVAGAVSYTIQIDDSETFSNPLTFTQTLGASQLTISTLPTIRMWWRVRANAASGAPGNWSSVRRVEVKS
jgi:Beta-propeller repeat